MNRLRSYATVALIAVGCFAWTAAVAFACEYSDTRSLANTFALGWAAAVIAIPLGAIINWLSWRQGIVARLITVASIGLLFFPLFLHVSLWDAAFGKLGWLTSTRGQVLTPIVSGWTAAAWIHGVAAAPLVAVVFWLGDSVGVRVHEEQALLDAGRWRVLFTVRLRQFVSLVLVAMVWVVLSCGREIAVTDIYRIGTLAEQIYLGYSLGSFGTAAGNWSTNQLQAATEFRLSWSLLPIGCFSILAAYGFTRLAQPDMAQDQWQPTKRQRSNIVANLLGVTLLIMLVLIPMGNVIFRCGYAVRPVAGEAVASFSIAQVGNSLTRACTDFGAEFFWSTMIASVSATCIVIGAVLLAWFAIRSSVWRWCWIVLLAVTLTLPGPLIGTTIASGFAQTQSTTLIWLYDRTIFAPTVATIVFCWPMAAMLVWHLFGRLDWQAMASMQLDTGSRWRTLWQLGIYGNGAALAGCWLLTFALCFGELSASQLVLPAGMDTLPRLMLGLLHAGVDEMTAAIAIVIAGVILVVSLAAYGLLARRVGRKRTANKR